MRLIELYKIIEDLREQYISENRTALEGGGDNQYLVYGHWFVLFACRLLIIKNGDGDIPQGDDANELVANAIKVVAEACSQQKAVAHYQMFRSPRTKDKLIAEISAKQLDFFAMLAK